MYGDLHWDKTAISCKIIIINKDNYFFFKYIHQKNIINISGKRNFGSQPSEYLQYHPHYKWKVSDKKKCEVNVRTSIK